MTANENQDMHHEAWQSEQVEAALSEADAGDFMPEKDMAAKLNQLVKAEQIMERVRKGEEVLRSLDDVERELGLDGAAPCR